MTELSLTIALERYDRHLPLFMGTVKAPAGLTLRALEVGMSPPRRDGVDRHRRILRNKEFDLAETSLSSHVIATSRASRSSAFRCFRGACSAKTTSLSTRGRGSTRLGISSASGS